MFHNTVFVRGVRCAEPTGRSTFDDEGPQRGGVVGWGVLALILAVMVFALAIGGGLAGCASGGGVSDGGAMIASAALIDARMIEQRGLSDESLERFRETVTLAQASLTAGGTTDPSMLAVKTAGLVVVGVAAREIEREGYSDERGRRFREAAAIWINLADAEHREPLRMAMAAATAWWEGQGEDAITRGLLAWREAVVAHLRETNAGGGER